MDHKTPEERRALFLAICETVLEKSISFRAACELHGVSHGQWGLWLARHFNNPEDRAHYTHCRECLSDAIAEEAIEIADSPALKNEFGIDRGDVDHKRLRFQARQWYLGKMSKRYSEKAHSDIEQTEVAPPTIIFEDASK
jgi:hypothetical protein